MPQAGAVAEVSGGARMRRCSTASWAWVRQRTFSEVPYSGGSGRQGGGPDLCRSHGYPGLRVMDGSVMPENVGVNRRGRSRRWPSGPALDGSVDER